PNEGRFPVYIVGDGEGNWSPRRKLEWDHKETSGIYTCGCGERVVLPDGKLLIPISYGAVEHPPRAVTSLLASFDGETVDVVEKGTTLRLEVARGLLEPSMTVSQGYYLMTIRAEDHQGYLTTSKDGLNWDDITPWRFDDG